LRSCNFERCSGLVNFYSKEQARAYIESLLEYYKARSEEYGQLMGELLRSTQASNQGQNEVRDAKQTKEGQKPLAKGWLKAGSLHVNTSDTQRALAEVTLRIVDDYKVRIEKTAEALKSFSEVESLNFSAESAFTLFINRGLPEAFILNGALKRPEAFAFATKFRAV